MIVSAIPTPGTYHTAGVMYSQSTGECGKARVRAFQVDRGFEQRIAVASTNRFCATPCPWNSFLPCISSLLLPQCCFVPSMFAKRTNSSLSPGPSVVVGGSPPPFSSHLCLCDFNGTGSLGVRRASYQCVVVGRFSKIMFMNYCYVFSFVFRNQLLRLSVQKEQHIDGPFEIPSLELDLVPMRVIRK